MENFIFCVVGVLQKLKTSEKKTQKINKVVVMRK